jgi:archaellum biogenesis ATPase FlaH
VILTGERGLGKSTLASQFVLEAVDQGYPALIYSGELTDWNVQEWFDRQAAGRDHINVAVSPNGFKRYLVKADIADRIHAWYDTRLYIRENNYKDDEEEETILDTVCTAVKQYGVKVVLIDNLMTAIEDDLAYDLYRQQSAFVRKCVKLTKDLKILIFLVVHPRKMNGRDHFSNDDVSGSSNITNLADLTLNYTRPAKDFQTDAPRVLQLTKNRINGTMIFDGIPLYYEEESKRIAETPYPTKVKKYGWEDEEVWSDTDNLDDIPF